jgi:hypothetical protein
MAEITILRNQFISLLEIEEEPLYSYGNLLIQIGDYYRDSVPSSINFGFTVELSELLYELLLKSRKTNASPVIQEAIVSVSRLNVEMVYAIRTNNIDSRFFMNAIRFGDHLRYLGTELNRFSNLSSDFPEISNTDNEPYSNQYYLEEETIVDANTLIAAISALIDAITLWRSARDRQASAKALQREFHKVKKVSNPEAVTLGNLVPTDLLDTMCERVYNCFKKYQQILENDKDYFPEDIDGATDTVIYCVCRELNRIYKLNHNIPPGKLSEWWNGYKCFTKLN